MFRNIDITFNSMSYFKKYRFNSCTKSQTVYCLYKNKKEINNILIQK